MPQVIINGTLEPVKQPSEYVFDPTRGVQRVDRWESAGDNLRGVAAAYLGLRVAYTFQPSAGKSVLVATASGPEAGQPEITTDTWQIMANEIQKDLREHPKSLGISLPVLQQINSGIKADRDPATITPALTGDANTLYALLFRGTTHYALGQYVLRHTTNVSNSYGVNVADFNIDCLYTTSQLIAEASNGFSWAFPIPGRLVFKLQNIAPPTSRAGYLWSWRKLPSSETTAAGNRVEITTEYWLEQWSTYAYPTAT